MQLTQWWQGQPSFNTLPFIITLRGLIVAWWLRLQTQSRIFALICPNFVGRGALPMTPSRHSPQLVQTLSPGSTVPLEARIYLYDPVNTQTKRKRTLPYQDGKGDCRIKELCTFLNCSTLQVTRIRCMFTGCSGMLLCCLLHSAFTGYSTRQICPCI